MSLERRGLKFYILKGHDTVTVDLETWGTWYEHADRRVERTKISSTIYISTVFLGSDHQFGEGPPLIFETMVFRDGDGEDMDRYTTWDQAVAGHNKFVALEMQRLGGS